MSALVYRIKRALHDRGAHWFCHEYREVVGWSEIKAATYTLPDGSTYTPDLNGVNLGRVPTYQRMHR